MRLVVTELRATPLDQAFSITKAKWVSRIRLHLCKYLFPSGSFTVSLLTQGGDLITSKTLTLADMQAAGSAGLQADYYHGFVSVIFDNAVALQPGTYTLRLSSSGYTYSSGEFMGWVRGWDDPANDATAASLIQYPLEFELYTYKTV